MDVLKNVKQILGFHDDSEDELLQSIIAVITDRLLAKLGGELFEIPKELNYIVVEASISRFNRVNDEGKKSASESDVSATYETDDLAPFLDDIQEWLTRNDSGKRRFMMY